MSKSIKLKDNTFWDTKSIVHNRKLLADIIYPVGSIYFSANNTNPSTYYGGTWVQIKNRFLFATNDTSGAKGKDSVSTITGTATQGNSGNTGGTTLETKHLPERTVIRHNVGSGKMGCTCNNSTNGWANICLYDAGLTANTAHTHTLNNHAHSIPYFQVYVWQRTA